MEKDTRDIFREMKNDISTYAEFKLELLKLNAYERTGKVIAILSYGLLLFALIFFAILFAFLALGFLLGKLLDSEAAGFTIVTGIYFILIIITILNKNYIKLKVINIIISALNSNEQKKNTTTNNQTSDAETTSTDTI